MLSSLDRLEGHPDWYIRTKVKTLNGNIIEVYHMPENQNTMTPTDEYMQAMFEHEDENFMYYNWTRGQPNYR